MKIIKLATVMTLIFAAPALAQPPAAAPAPAATPAKFGPQSTFKELLANPKAKAMLYERLPLIMQVFDAGLFEDSATLKQVSDSPEAQSGGGFTPDIYQQLVKDLAAL